jgi:hypothetical protein
MVVKIVCNLTEIYCSFVPPHQTRELFIYFFPSSVAVSTQPCGEEKKKDMETIKRVMMSLLGLQKWLERERLTAFFGAPFELLANRWCCWLYE